MQRQLVNLCCFVTELHVAEILLFTVASTSALMWPQGQQQMGA